MPRVDIAQLDEASAGQVREIAVTTIASRIVTALRNGSGRLQVIVRDVAPNGRLRRRGNALAGAATRISVTDWPAGPGVITAVRTASGDLKVTAWKINAAGRIERAGDASAGAVSETAISPGLCRRGHGRTHFLGRVARDRMEGFGDRCRDPRERRLGRSVQQNRHHFGMEPVWKP